MCGRVQPSAVVAIPLLLSCWCFPPSPWQISTLGMVQPAGAPAVSRSPGVSSGRGRAALTAGCPSPLPQEPCNGCWSAEGHRSHHLGRGKVRPESLPRLAFPWMAASMPSICPDCSVQTEPPFVPPKKPHEPVAALQPLPSPATNSCCLEGRVLGSTCCHHSCRETPALEGWKDLAGNVRFAKLSAGQGLWAGTWRH